MKLRNKKTGENYETTMPIVFNIKTSGGGEHTVSCESIAELTEEWEDVPEEPKDISGIDIVLDAIGEYCNEHSYYSGDLEKIKILNIVEEKLKAWKRLKDGGITFKNWTINQTGTIDCFATWGDNIPPSRKDPTLQEDLDLLFGGEE